ncbi:MAG TPA: DUF5004 domain-containing protein [Flavobacteriales bacterium]|nr:DUF5004 domain-containing protein [Flavobacteriales bacterium]
MKTVVFVAALAIAGMTSCSKEEVTPLERVKEKLNLEGRWAIESVTTNGTDATTTFTETNGSDYTLELNQDKTYTIYGTTKRTTGEGTTTETTTPTVQDQGTWSIQKIDHESPKTIALSSEVNGSTYNAYTLLNNCENSMALQQESGGNVSVYRYKKQN